MPPLPLDPRAALHRAETVAGPGAIVVGHSLGGVVALRLAGRRPVQ